MIDNGRESPKTHVLAVGVYNAYKEEVDPGFLSILDPGPAHIVPPNDIASTGRRTALAEWLASSQNPLTPRVMVNRIWHYHFGRGIAGTPSDFGAMRDSILEVSGRLNLKMGGPGVFPPLPAGVETRGGWKKDEEASEAERRSVYVFVRRNTRYPMFEVFDMPDTHESCPRRNATVTGPQALELLNNEMVLEWSRSLAGRVLNDAGLTPEAQIDRAWRFVYSRPASNEERKDAAEFLERQTRILEMRLAKSEKLVVPDGLPPGVDPARAAALVDLCHMLVNSNEFLYV